MSLPPGLIFVAATPFHWAGKTYSTNDRIDTTGWNTTAVQEFMHRCPVYLETASGTGGTGGPETDPVAGPEVTAETARAEAAEATKAASSALTSETSRATAAESAEASRAQAAEATKAAASALTTETSRAQGAESAEATRAQGAESAEASRAQAAEATKAATSALTTETSRAQAAETANTTAEVRAKLVEQLLSRITVLGHSLAAGGGASTQDRAWQNLVAGMFRSEVVDYAKGGGVLVWGESGVVPYGQTGDGGYARVGWVPPPPKVRDYKGAYAAGTTYKAGDVVWTGASLDALSWWRSQVDANTGHDPTTDGGANWMALAGDQARQWSPAGRLPIVMYGLNDLGWDGNETAFLAALRYVYGYLTASEVTSRADDPRCSFTAGWAASAVASSTNSVSGSLNGHIKGLPATVTDYEDIVLPADFPGGAVTLGYVGTQATPTTGQISVFLDGSGAALQVFNMANVMTHSAGKVGCFAIRIPNLPAGAHHLRVQCTTLWDQGAIYSDYLAIEANPAPPVVIAGGSFYPLATYVSVYGAGTTASDANVDKWNADVAAMCGGELPTAFFWDVSSVIGKGRVPANFTYDGLHPADHIHGDLALSLRDLIENTVIPSLTTRQIARLARAPRVGHTVRLDFGADYGGGSWNAPLNTWADFTYGTTGTGNPLRTVELSLKAEAGDVVELSLIGAWSNTATAAGNVDIYTVGWPNGTSAASAPVNWVSSGGPAQAANGIPNGSALNAGVYAPLCQGPLFYKVRPEDVVGGEVTFRVQAKGLTVARGILLAAANPVIFSGRVVGQWEPYQGARQSL